MSGTSSGAGGAFPGTWTAPTPGSGLKFKTDSANAMQEIIEGAPGAAGRLGEGAGPAAARKSTQFSNGSTASEFDVDLVTLFASRMEPPTHPVSLTPTAQLLAQSGSALPPPVSMTPMAAAAAASVGARDRLASGSRASNGGASGAEAAETLQQHLSLLTHAASCDAPACALPDCAKMKAFMAHANMCEAGASFKPSAASKCNLCRRYTLLAHLHSRLCTKPIGHCRVPKCGAFKIQYSDHRDSASELSAAESDDGNWNMDFDEKDARASTVSSFSDAKELSPAQILAQLMHAGRCQGCPDARCVAMKRELEHTTKCPQAPAGCLVFKYCMPARHLLTHHANCADPTCDRCREARALRGALPPP